MALRFVLGSSGAGKSRLLFETALHEAQAHPDLRYIILVPEQFTMQTQRELVSLSPVGGILNIDVLSFTRLAYRVFESTGVKKRTVLTETGKSLLLRLIAAREASGLSLLQGAIDRPGCLSELKSILSELDQYGIGEAELDGIISDLEGSFSSGKGGLSAGLITKLREIRDLHEAFSRCQADRFITAQLMPQVLCEKAPSCDFLHGAYIYLDGYTGFTPAQLDIIAVLLPMAAGMTVTVTIPEKSLRLWKKGGWDKIEASPVQDHELFALSRRTIQALIRTARAAGVEIDEEPVLLDGSAGRLKKGSELSWLEEHLLRPGAMSPFPGTYEGQICLRPCTDPADEVLSAAVHIDSLTKKQGLHYRDIAIVCGNLEAYAEFVRKTFAEYEIPVFIDRSVSVVLNPAFEFTAAACAVLDSNFSYESMMRLFRTGFILPSMEEADLLDNYILAAGVRGQKAWSEPWERECRTVSSDMRIRAEELRAAFMEHFSPFAAVMKKNSMPLEDYARALWELITAFELPRKLDLMKERAHEAGRLDREREYSQVTGVICSVLDEAVGLIGSEKVTRRQFEEILQAGFSEARIGIIPPGTDEVHVGDLERSRLNRTRIIFFLGLNDGYVPAVRSRPSVLTDMERELLRSRNVHLAPTLREEAGIQQFYLYLMMTKPEEQLILSWSASGSDGEQMRPSYLVSQIRELFPQAKILPPASAQSMELIRSMKTGLPVLSRELSGIGLKGPEDAKARASSVRELLKIYLPDSPYRELVLTIISSASEKVRQAILGELKKKEELARLSATLAQELFGQVLYGSVSRLEAYAGCAYFHFLQYGLKLEEREEYEIRRQDLGNLIHSAMELFCRRMLEQDEYDWNSLPDEVRDVWVEECLAELSGKEKYDIFHSSARYQAMEGRVGHILKRSVWAMQKQIRAGLFLPASFELGFDSVRDLSAVNLDLDNGNSMRLTGRIDRVDLSEDRENKILYVKVTDYKSGSRKLDLDEFCDGRQMQLIVYMDAAVQMEELAHRGERVVCAGIFYYTLHDPVVKWESADMDVEQALFKKMKPEGLVNDDPAVLRRLDCGLDKRSEVIPVSLNKDGLPDRNSHTVNTAQMEILRSYAREKMRQIGNSVLSGRIHPEPARDGERKACDYCPYQDVCGFDPGQPRMRYRDLKRRKKDEQWEYMEKAVRESQGGK